MLSTIHELHRLRSSRFKGGYNDDYQSKLNEHYSVKVFGGALLRLEKGMNNDRLVMLCMLLWQETIQCKVEGYQTKKKMDTSSLHHVLFHLRACLRITSQISLICGLKQVIQNTNKYHSFIYLYQSCIYNEEFFFIIPKGIGY